MPPLNRIEAVCLHNTQHWPSGRWVPMRFELESWVTLNPDPASEWGRDSSRYPPGSQQYLWKAQVKGFEFGHTGGLISRVKVRHAYEPWQLHLDPDLPQPRIPCNYLFPTYFDDWVDPASIVGLVMGMHAEVGTLIHHDRSARELYEASIFFYKWIYVPPAGQRLYGELEEIPLPRFSSPSWSLPDMMTSEVFRAKMRLDFRGALKPSTSSRQSHLQWFMPLHVFVDLFASAPTRTRSPTLYTIRDIDDVVFGDLMDAGWDQKTTDCIDVIRCTVNHPSVWFRFHIARQTLYANFYFVREKWVAPRDWMLMEQDVAVRLVAIKCDVINNIEPPEQLTFTVGEDWPVSHLRHEVQIAMGPDAPVDFKFIVSEPRQPDKKIHQRSEKKIVVADVLPPKTLKIKSYN